MRINDKLINEVIENEGELCTGPVSVMGVFRLALDLREARDEMKELRAENARIARAMKKEFEKEVRVGRMH